MFNPREHKPKKVTKGLRRAGGSFGPLPSTFGSIYPIDMLLGTYNELPLYFQLSLAKWCLTGFYGNHSYINDVTRGRHLEILSLRFYPDLK